MQTVIESKMKQENIIATAGMAMLLIAYLISFNETDHSSPLALIIIAATGLLLRFRYPLTGNMILFFSCLALAVFPFLYAPNYWLIPGAAMSGYAGFAGFIRWWQDDK